MTSTSLPRDRRPQPPSSCTRTPPWAATVSSEGRALAADTGAPELWLVGHSWGAAIVAHASPGGLAARVLVAPPVTMLDLPSQPERTLVQVPAHDQFGPPAEVDQALSSWPDVTLEIIDGCDHFLAGAISRITDRTVDWLTDP